MIFGPRHRPVVTVYTRRNCGLCRQAEATVTHLARRKADVELVDIDEHPELTDRYTVRVPVVAIDGEELFDHQVDPGLFRVLLREVRRGNRVRRAT